MRSRSLFAGAALGLASFLAVPVAGAAPSPADVQANKPQVAGDPTSDQTARFPTNKQNETTIAVNPLQSRFLIAGANDEQRQPPCGPGPIRGADALPSDCSFFPNVGTSGVYTSSDGGQTWTNRGLLDDQPSWRSSRLISDGDPFIVYGPRPDSQNHYSYANGVRAYYATLASYRDNVGPYPANKAPEVLAVSTSDDNGHTWSRPVLATTKMNPNNFNDKESIWVDDLPSSPYFGRVYVSFTQFRSATQHGNGSEPIEVAVSTDGAQSFGPPKQLSPAGNNGTGNGRQGSMVRSGPDGSVYVIFEQGFSQVVSISRDGGVRWSRPLTVGAVADIDSPIPGASFRTDSFPSLAADPRVGSRTLYAAWVNKTAGGGRLVVTTSTNRGLTWSAPQTVSSAAQGYAFFQGLDVAPTGRVDLGFEALVARNPATFGTGNATIDDWYTTKPVGGTWSTPRKVSTVSSDPAASSQNNLAAQFWGDYSTLVSSVDTAWFISTDSRNGQGCPAVDAYQRDIAGTSAVREDGEDVFEQRLGRDPYAEEPVAKPAPLEVCPPQFGNTDAYVQVIAP